MTQFDPQMVAQMLMQPVGKESLDNSIADENFFQPIEIPSPMVAPLDMQGGFFISPEMAGKIAYGGAVTGASFIPGAGFVDAAGGAVDITGQPLPSFGENIRQGNYLDAALQGLGVAGDVATVAAPATLGTSLVLASLLKAPGAARKVTKATDVASDLQGLANEAQKAGSFDNFKKDFTTQIKHGKYYHITSDPNFKIDPDKGPSDTMSTVMTSPSKGGLMITSDLGYWADSYGDSRPFVVEIDMSDVPRGDYEQVSRGQGNEFFIKDASKAKVTKVMTLDEAEKQNEIYRNKLPQSENELKQFYDKTVSSDVAGIAKVEPPTETKPGIIAFHGSGADFNEFKLEKIGTGEGAQAFGHGLYFTDSEDIAKFYKNNVGAGNEVTYKGKTVADLDSDSASYEENIAHMIGQQNNQDDRKRVFNNELSSNMRSLSGIKQAIKDFNDDPVTYPLKFQGMPLEMQDALRIQNDFEERVFALNQIEKNFDTIKTKPRGKTYKVAIQPKPEELLDYDLPLSEQPTEIQNAFKKIYYEQVLSKDEILKELYENPKDITNKVMGLFPNSKGSQAYRTLADNVGGEKRMSELLNKAGIKGIKFLSGGARNTFGGELLSIDKTADGQFRAKVVLDNPNRQTGLGGSGRTITTSKPYKTEKEARDWADKSIGKEENNYVIFDDKLINILEKYGIVGPVAVSATAAALRDDDGST